MAMTFPSTCMAAMSRSILMATFVCLLLLLLLLLRSFISRQCGVPVINFPLIGMLPSLIANSHRVHDFAYDILRTGGGTLRFHGPWLSGMGFLLTCDPANANHVLNHCFANYPRGDAFYEAFQVFLGDGIINSDGKRWKTQRKAALSLMGSRRFLGKVAVCTTEKVENGLVPLLNLMADRGEQFDLCDVFLRFILDTSCDLTFGVDTGSLTPDFPVIPFSVALDHAEHGLLFRYTVPVFWWKLLRMLGVGPEGRMASAMEVINGFIGKIIAKRREELMRMHANGEEAPGDVLSSYMNLPAEIMGDQPDKFLRDTLVTLIAAGKDATGVSMAWFFWLLCKNPCVEDKLFEELKEMNLSDKEEVCRLVYLHAALYEALRLYPTVPFSHKEVLCPDVLPSGHRVDKGSMILISIYAMGRMESVWGKDCLEFKPERWINNEGKLKHEPTYKFLSFNSGPRACLGKDIVITQMKIVVASLVRKFHFQLAEGHVVEPKNAIVLGMKKGMKVLVRKRAWKDNTSS